MLAEQTATLPRVAQRTFIVGDVHGCLDELNALLRKAGWSADDRLVLVGDLVAKGPDSQGVVQRARELGALGVLGNHDDRVLKRRDGKGLKKHHADVAAVLTDPDWRYLEKLPLYLELDDADALVVHGGLMPGVALREQERHVLLNLRSIDDRGRPSTRVSEGAPWVKSWKGPRTVVFGHDALRGLQQHRHGWGLDTGCVYGRELSGVWLPEGKLVQVKARREWWRADD